MVYSFVEKSQKKPTWFEMLHSIKRNFGGLDSVDPVEIFKINLAPVLSSHASVSYAYFIYLCSLKEFLC